MEPVAPNSITLLPVWPGVTDGSGPLHEYASYTALFPRAAAVVHQGGIGTTAQALRAGKPMLVVPYAHDQPDNAFRVERLGVARVIYPKQYRTAKVVEVLGGLLGDMSAAGAAAAIAARMAQEDGPGDACDVIERVLRALPAR